MKPTNINLGCGTNILKGWINLDCVALAGVDVVHDLNVLPLPFENECASEILCEDVLEHLNYIPLLKECHHILLPGGRVRIEVPHFTSSNNYVDPTHRNMFSIKTFNFFCAETFEGKGVATTSISHSPRSPTNRSRSTPARFTRTTSSLNGW